jgi:thiamine kinase-like enzyme
MSDAVPVAESFAVAVARLPIWSGRVDPVPLTGGITNHNFVVEDHGQRYVVRVGTDIPVHGVVRANELAASRAAHAAGISPRVVYAEPGVMVIDYIEGRTFTPEDVRSPANLPRLVELVRRCHRDVPQYLRGPAAMFWVFHVVRDYAHTLREGDSVHVPRLDGLLNDAALLERAVGPIDVVFGHNDLLAANILDDGKRLWLLDFDYAGYNSPLFDLGGLASNSELPPDQANAILEHYFGCAPSDELKFRAAAMLAASLLREAMWSMVSEIHSKVNFDYATYTSDNLRRYGAALNAFTHLESS